MKRSIWNKTSIILMLGANVLCLVAVIYVLTGHPLSQQMIGILGIAVFGSFYLRWWLSRRPK